MNRPKLQSRDSLALCWHLQRSVVKSLVPACQSNVSVSAAYIQHISTFRMLAVVGSTTGSAAAPCLGLCIVVQHVANLFVIGSRLSKSYISDL